jgi:phosphate-selective porin
MRRLALFGVTIALLVAPSAADAISPAETAAAEIVVHPKICREQRHIVHEVGFKAARVAYASEFNSRHRLFWERVFVDLWAGCNG